MKIVIQCANSKSKNATRIADKIEFVGKPETKSQFRPDDNVPNSLKSWRDYLTSYNRNYKINGDNKWKLLKAWELYKNKVYKQVIDKIGEEDVFILSAGWGLVKSDFLLPSYNVTFSNSAPKIYRRKPIDVYNDYNQLTAGYTSGEVILFFGGGSYLKQFYELTKDIANKDIIIYHATDNIVKHPEYSYKKYPRCFTNWHYQAIIEDLL